MKIQSQKIKGLFLIKPNPFRQKTAILRRKNCKELFMKKKINSNIKQANISENKKKTYFKRLSLSKISLWRR